MRCPKCQGNGYLMVVIDVDDNKPIRAPDRCTMCDGEGVLDCCSGVEDCCSEVDDE